LPRDRQQQHGEQPAKRVLLQRRRDRAADGALQRDLDELAGQTLSEL